jgi:alcohol dehydrogenase (cytochrome c)
MMVINANVNPDANTTGMMSINPDARKGPRKTLTGIPCKTGIAWSFDAANGEFLWAKSTVEQNVVARIGPKGEVTPNEDVVMKEFNKAYRICPTYTGGRDWPMGAYNPKSGLMYMPMSNLCHNSTARSDRPSTPANGYNTTNVPMLAAGKDKVGRIDAVNVETGKTEWTWETRVGNYSPMLTTGGGLVFNGGLDRYLRAFDADNGTLLWQTRLPQTTAGGIASYSIGGKQYIAVVAGSGALAGGQVQMTPEADMGGTGDAVYVFALSQ